MVTKPDVEQPTDTWEIEYVKAALRNQGGHKATMEQMDRSRKIQRLMWDEQDALMEKYPGKWVVMGEGGVLALGDSLNEVICEIDSRGIGRNEVAVERLSPFPSFMPRPRLK